MEYYLDMKTSEIMPVILSACVRENRKELRSCEVPSLEMYGGVRYAVSMGTGGIQGKKTVGSLCFDYYY